MAGVDLLVLGGGISGVSLAAQVAKAGRSVTVVEEDSQIGGCLRTERRADGFWWELGAHTCYNSYGALLSLLEERGALGRLAARKSLPFRMFVDGRLCSIGSLVHKWELLTHAPRMPFVKKDGRTVRGYYSAFTGPRNYNDVFGPLFAAVPSQRADDFPADMLFKKRDRRKDVLRSWSMENGLQTAVEVLAQTPGVSLRTGSAAVRVEPRGAGFAVTLASGEVLEAARLALALPPPAAAQLLAPAYPALAAALGRIAWKEIVTVGVALDPADTAVEPVAGIVPPGDIFFSAVSRDVVPGAQQRGFAFHFRPGTTLDEALDRITAVLGAPREKLQGVVERKVVLPSPVLGHRALLDEIGAALAQTPLYLTGNYFGGLAIEDCVQRSRSEAQRLLGAA